MRHGAALGHLDLGQPLLTLDTGLHIVNGCT